MVLATNAYSRELPGPDGLRERQYPLWTYQVVTEPLSDEQWQEIGWRQREAFGDNRQMLHYFRPTTDGRIVMAAVMCCPVRAWPGKKRPRPRPGSTAKPT
ncbi:FAD-dependent oxidoreductase [Pseudomonas sp. MPFS]|uniref:FAD-dependent oxidoreductase n=1 Tax=Pseudomonas sp. MPFS TaxID=2795724 RepID=UPI00321794C2